MRVTPRTPLLSPRYFLFGCCRKGHTQIFALRTQHTHTHLLPVCTDYSSPPTSQQGAAALPNAFCCGVDADDALCTPLHLSGEGGCRFLIHEPHIRLHCSTLHLAITLPHTAPTCFPSALALAKRRPQQQLQTSNFTFLWYNSDLFGMQLLSAFTLGRLNAHNNDSKQFTMTLGAAAAAAAAVHGRLLDDEEAAKVHDILWHPVAGGLTLWLIAILAFIAVRMFACYCWRTHCCAWLTWLLSFAVPTKTSPCWSCSCRNLCDPPCLCLGYAHHSCN